MKKILLALLLLSSLPAIKAHAQMEAAQTIKWDISKSVDINMPLEMTWEVFSNNNLLKKASNGYVSTIEVLDANPPVSRKIVFSNGGSRVENITQNEPHNKLIAINFADANLPKGIKSAEFAIFLKDKDGKTNVIWRAMIKGDAEAKKALVTQLTAEFDSYATGLDKMTKKSIPAAKLN